MVLAPALLLRLLQLIELDATLSTGSLPLPAYPTRQVTRVAHDTRDPSTTWPKLEFE